MIDHTDLEDAIAMVSFAETVTPEHLRALSQSADDGELERFIGGVFVQAADALRAAADEIERLQSDITDLLSAANAEATAATEAADKIEGLTCDLRMAVETAYRRGATDWARRNYPKWFAEFQAAGNAK